MRLIDADKLEKEMLEKCVGDCGCCDTKQCPALNQPTVYEVRETIKQQGMSNPIIVGVDELTGYPIYAEEEEDDEGQNKES